jgi:hypothetical protein
MFGEFDPKLVEYSSMVELPELADVHFVSVYKIGGGTVGNKYVGNWGYAVYPNGNYSTPLKSGTDLYTGFPVDHCRAAELVALIYAV